MRFVDYFGLCHNHHIRIPRLVPVPENDPNQFSIDESKATNAQLLGEKIRQQLRSFPRKDQEKLLKTLEINVRFGTFYLNDKGNRLREMSRFNCLNF